MYVIICRNPRTNGVFLVTDSSCDEDDPKTAVFETLSDAESAADTTLVCQFCAYEIIVAP